MREKTIEGQVLYNPIKTMKTTIIRFLSLVLFGAGVLTGIALTAGATFADVEAVFYGFDRFGNKPTSAFYCPVMIDSSETGVILAVIENPTDREIRPTVRFQSSTPTLFRTEVNSLSIPPGGRVTMQWEITRRDLAYQNFIFAKMMTYASYPAPDVEQTCGVLVLDLPGLTGKQAVGLTVLISLVGMAAGCGLWLLSTPTVSHAQEAWPAMLTLTVVVLASMGTVWLAIWPAGVLLLAFSLILIGVIVGHFVQSSPHRA